MSASRSLPLAQAWRQSRRNWNHGISMDENAEFSMAQQSEPMSVAANVATATVEQTGTALIFRVGRSVDIPSDGSPHKTTIARDNLPCTFDYVSAPVIEENVHLRANISNTTERVLLSGDASIFLSGEYVGTTSVKTTAPGEKFKIFLDIDDGIKVKRELIERAVDKRSEEHTSELQSPDHLVC